MKSRDILFPVMAAMAASFGSCSQEPIVTIDPVVEEYTRNFIKEFGIPEQGHDFAMAMTAGLKVKTARGGHVTVTAEIDGKNYLFADLDVPVGTHVTLKCNRPKGQQWHLYLRGWCQRSCGHRCECGILTRLDRRV
ncbi:MAG: hypothetical protein K2K37_03205 [Muribaculaceae bacterium]|nr:hypothetical protein [Muribaculaceae bacterium]